MNIEEGQAVSIDYKRKEKKIKMLSRLWNMNLLVSLPLMIVILVLATVGIMYVFRYNAILNNVTMASEFNQNFKDDGSEDVLLRDRQPVLGRSAP